ncbi:MAG: UMP kinase [Treponema sp.]|nr:UMP kinase [Treponema sp.]
MTKVISLGGSIVVPDKPDTEFLNNFLNTVKEWLNVDEKRRLILVIGGGAPARIYQNAYKTICGDSAYNNNEADWIGITATRLNAQLLKAIFGSLCKDDVVYDPTAVENFNGRILVAAGWKPGFSTDTDAVLLAHKFGAKTVINLSNIEKVYTDDPRKNPNAKPLDTISWKDFMKIVGEEWVPGKNTPFDPIASRKASEFDITVICAGGKNIENIRDILDDKIFIGTKISN